MEATREVLDLAIIPQVDGVELRDWKAYGPAVDAGYRATMAAGDRIAALMGGG
jgi:NTE family protein